MGAVYAETTDRTPFGAIRQHGLVQFPENTAGRDFVVGDIHGQARDLWRAMEAVGFDVTCDRLFAVGDLIDRGPDSMRCLELAFEPWFFPVLGNHEDFFLGAMIEEDQRSLMGLMQNGGGWILSEDEGDLKAYAAELSRLPLAIEVPFRGRTIGIVHAAVTSGQWGRFDLDADIWNRRIADKKVRQTGEVPAEALVDGIDAVVVGHNVLDEPRMLGNTLMLDTGADRGNPLTLWALDDVVTALEVHRASKAVCSYFPRRPSQITAGAYQTGRQA